MNKKSALGKGIASLIQPTTKDSALSKYYGTDTGQQNQELASSGNPLAGPLLVDISHIKANKDQPRKIFKEKSLEELAQSIKENGILQPLVVSQMENGHFEVVAGERRLRAAQKAGLTKVPVILKRVTDKDKLVMAIIENVQRADLNCVEEGLAYFQLMEDFKLTQEEVAKKIGKERSTIANFLRILKLPRDVVKLLHSDELSFGHGKLLASLKETEKIKRLAFEVVEKQMSVRELEKFIKKEPKAAKSQGNTYFNEKLDKFRENLEKRTGFHFAIKSKGKSGGSITLKFSNEAEFNDIYEFLMK